MKVTNFLIEPAMFVPGDEVTISFTVKAESGDTIGANGLMVYMGLSTGGEIACYRDTTFTITAGSTKAVSARTVLLASSYADTTERGTVLSAFGVVLGLFGSRVNISFPVTLLDAWYLPTVKLLQLDRATEGVLDDEGENLLADVQLGISASADISVMRLRLYYSSAGLPTTASAYINLTSAIPDLLVGVTDSASLIARTFSKASDWYFLLVFGDDYEAMQAGCMVARSFANMHLSGSSTGGVCFGGFSKSTDNVPMTESYYPFFAYEGIYGVTDFSTKEVCTYGKWIDDKLIYRKTVTFSVAKNADTTSSVISADMDSVVLVTGTFYRPESAESEEKWFPINFWYSDTSYANCQVTKEKTIQVRAGWAGTAYVTVFYTKT